MTTDKDCMGYARECVRLAGLTTDQEMREKLFAIARDWMAAALDDRYVNSPPPALVVVKSETAAAQAIVFDPAKALRKLQSLSRRKR
jgi:hypothetical protein